MGDGKKGRDGRRVYGVATVLVSVEVDIQLLSSRDLDVTHAEFMDGGRLLVRGDVRGPDAERLMRQLCNGSSGPIYVLERQYCDEFVDSTHSAEFTATPLCDGKAKRLEGQEG